MSDQMDSDQLTTSDLKQTIATLQSEIDTKNRILKEVKDLTEICGVLNEHQPTATLYVLVDIIDALKKKLSISPQTAFDTNINNPGPESEEGSNLFKDPVIKNRDLYKLVKKLMKVIVENDNHRKELQEKALEAAAEQQNSNEKQSQEIQALREQNEMKDSAMVELRGTLKKYETDFKNEKENIQKQLHDAIQKCERIERENQSHMEVKCQLESEIKELKETVEAQQSEIVEHESRMNESPELARIITNLLAMNKEINIFCEMLLDSRRKLLRPFEIHEPGNPLPELDQGDSNESIQERERLRRENQINMATIRRVESEVGKFRAKVAEKDAMMAIMIDSLKAYIADYKSENKEKEDIQKRMHESSQQRERLGRENKSLMATIRHLEREIERMKQLLNEKNKDRARVNESTSTRQTNTTSNPPKSSPTLIECPYCSRSYPNHLIEGHVQDCMEDSLCMDD